jgi:hypothetical protein
VTVAPSQIGQRIVSGPVGLTTHALATAPAPDGKLYVIVELSIENVGQGSLGYSPIYFRLSDASGAGYVAGAPGTTLPAAAGPTGLLARANVAFEVPAGARGLTLSYEPTPVPSGYQTIKIALGE